MNHINLKDQDFVFFGFKSKLKGSFQLQGISHIAGEVEGEIIMEDQKLLTLEPTSIVNGKIFCHDVEIFGTFIGEIEATGKVSVFPSAYIQGSINSNSLSIHPGAQLNMEGKTL